MPSNRQANANFDMANTPFEQCRQCKQQKISDLSIRKKTMALYCIGDIQGCDDAFERLLQTVDFSASRDTLYVLGDLVISVERAEEQAKDFGHSVKREMAFLTVHGMLHLQGHDHETDTEAEAMEALETVILARLGYTDPYAVEH